MPVSPDVYVHRIGRTGRVGRSGRAITFYEPRQARDIQAIERHAGVKLSPWVKDAHVAPTPITAPPRRHSKPRASANGDAPSSKVIVSGGRAAGLEPSDIIHAITSATHLDGESVRNVRVLERFAFAEVPEKDAERVVRGDRRHRDPRPRAAPRARAHLSRGPGAATPAPADTRAGISLASACGPTAATSPARAVLWRRHSPTDPPTGGNSLRLKSLMSRRPSAAIVISSAALFMSLGGVGYAAISIPNNSVGAAQLKNNAVTNSKINNGAVSFKKIQPGAVGLVRANTGQLQVRVSGTCASGTAIGTINQVGKVTCNNALPSEFGTTNNSATVTSTAATVTSVALPTGASYLAFANPTATVTSGGAGQHVTVTCTLTVGSNTADALGHH